MLGMLTQKTMSTNKIEKRGGEMTTTLLNKIRLWWHCGITGHSWREQYNTYYANELRCDDCDYGDASKGKGGEIVKDCVKQLTINEITSYNKRIFYPIPPKIITWITDIYGDEKFTLEDIVDKCVANQYTDFANWLVVRFMSHVQRVQYAVFASSLVLNVWEAENGADLRPRKAVEAAKAWLSCQTQVKADEASDTVYNAISADIYPTYCAVYAAAYAAYKTAASAACAGDSGKHAARAGFYACTAGSGKIRGKILNYGLKLGNKI